MVDYYEILEVHPKASPEIIKKAYFILAKKYHPDVYPDKQYAIRKMALLNEAYAVLSNPEKRRDYDARRNRTTNNANYHEQAQNTSSERNSSQNSTQQKYKNSNGFNNLSPLQICILRALHLAKEKGERIFYPKNPLSLKRKFGFGYTLMWKKEEDRFSGSYIKTCWFSFFGIPIFPVNEYRILRPSSDSYIIISSKKSLGLALSQTLSLVIWFVVFMIGLFSYIGSKSSQPQGTPYKAVNKAPAKNAPAKQPSKLIPKTGIVTGYVKGQPVRNNDGLSTIEIDNSKNNAPVYVRIWSLDDIPRPVRCFTIKEGEKFTAKNISPGNYDIRFKYLYKDKDAKAGAKSKPIKIEETPDPISEGIRYTQYSLTLFPVRNGNTHMDTISVDEI